MNHRLINIIYIYLFVQTVLLSPVSASTYILYTANINGSIQNCSCGHNPLGGLDRLKSFIDDFKTKHAQTIVIDGGDFFNSYPFPELNTAMLKTIPLVNYDIMLPGDNAFMESEEFISDYILQNNQRILISNLNNSGKSYKLFNTNDAKIYIWGYLSKDVFNTVSYPDQLRFDELAIENNLLRAKTDFSVLIYHGITSDLEFLLKKNSHVNLVLAAHDQINGTIEIAGRKVVGTGRDGEVVAIIRLDGNKDGYTMQIDYQEIGLSLPANPEIVELISEYKIKLASGKSQ